MRALNLASIVLISLSTIACGTSSQMAGKAEGGNAVCRPPEWSPDYETVSLPTPDHDRTEAHAWNNGLNCSPIGIVFVTGIDGGFLEPVDGIYTRMAEAFGKLGVPSVFVQYREPGNVRMSVDDARAGVNYLKSHGVQRMGLVGWSFGGAVITNTPPEAPEIRTVVGISPQSEYTETVERFTSQSMLLFASEEDENVPFEASRQILEVTPASVRTRFVPFDHGDHELNGMQDEVDPIVRQWLVDELKIES
jgi:alpha/beta superfamily hydrolase